MLLPALENDIAVVDENDAGRALCGKAEGIDQLVIEVTRAGNGRAIEQKELALEAVGQRAADGRLTGAGRSRQQHAALGAQGQLFGQRVVFQRRDDVGLQAVDQVVEPAQVVE